MTYFTIGTSIGDKARIDVLKRPRKRRSDRFGGFSVVSVACFFYLMHYLVQSHMIYYNNLFLF